MNIYYYVYICILINVAMDKYIEIIKNSFTGYANYLWHEITHPTGYNYFYYLIAVSLLVLTFEVLAPWREKQAVTRKGFWQDVFYMFFNFFLFSLIGYNALSNVAVELHHDVLRYFGYKNLVALEVNSWPTWLQFLLMFVLADFIQWSVHVMLHRFPWLWKFHQVHHSVEEMSFAAHLRFHPMETIIYKTALFIPLTMIGFGIKELFFLHAFNILIGHLNHANINLNYGKLKYVLNSPGMHIWHHAKYLPKKHPHGMNFGITLSIWDYLFNTAYEPHSGKDIELGFEDIENYPTQFHQQMIEPFKKK